LVATPFGWRLVSTVRAALCKEILFRGYAIERLQEISGSAAAAGIISCTIFALAHVGEWGWTHLLVAGVVGAMFTLLYVWRRNIWANAIAHFIVDGAVFLVS
jgi:membrane protease YdiL (CAAX protease family)